MIAITGPVAAQTLPLGERLSFTLRSNVVAVQAEFPDGSLTNGFGLVVADQAGQALIVTAAHVVRDLIHEVAASRVVVRWHHERRVDRPAELLDHHDADIDLAVRRTKTPPNSTWFPVALGSVRQLERGTPLWFLGRGGRWYVPSSPAQFNELDPDFGILIDDLDARPGSSGGAIIADGGLVGMLLTAEAGDISSALPIDVIAERLAGWNLPWALSPLSLSRTRPLAVPGVAEAIEAGDRLFEQHSHDEAIASYTQARKLDPYDAVVLRRMIIAMRHSLWRAAQIPWRLFLGNMAVHNDHPRDIREALWLIDELIKLDSTLVADPELLLERSYVLRAIGRGTEGLEFLEAAFPRHRDDPRILSELGLLQAATSPDGEIKGIDLLGRAVELEPGDPMIRRHLAFALEIAGQTYAAMRAYSEAARLAQGDTPISALIRVAASRQVGALFDDLEKSDPRGVLGSVHEMGLEERIALLEDLVLEDRGMRRNALYYLARLQHEVGRDEPAEVALRGALELDRAAPADVSYDRLRSPSLRPRIELLVELLGARGSDPALLFFLESQVLGKIRQGPPVGGAGQGDPELVIQSGHASTVKSVDISPDGRWIASGSSDRTVRIWERQSGRVVRSLPLDSIAVCAVAFSTIDSTLAVVERGQSDREGRISLWDANTGALTRVLDVDGSPLCGLGFDSEGLVVSLDETGVVTWSKPSTGLPVRRLDLGKKNPLNFALSSDARTLAVIFCCDGEVRVLESHSGDLRLGLDVDFSGLAHLLAFSPDGRQLAVAGYDASIVIFDTLNGTRRQVIHTEIGRGLDAVVFSPDGKALAVASNQAAFELWDAIQARRIKQLGGPVSLVKDVVWSPDGKFMITGHNRGNIEVWDVERGESLSSFAELNGEATVALDPKGRRLVVGVDGWNASGRVWHTAIWDFEEARLLCQIEQAGPFYAIGFSPDERYIALGNTSNYTIDVWDTGCRRNLGAFDSYSRHAFAFSPDARRLAHVAQSDAQIQVRDLDSFEVVRTLVGHDETVMDLAYSPDGKILASASSDATIQLWDATNGKSLHRLRGHRWSVDTISWSSDGTRLASAGRDKVINIWDADSGRLIQRFQAFFSDEKPSYADPLFSVRFGPDDSFVAATSNADDVVTLWEVGSGKFLGALQGSANLRLRSVDTDEERRKLVVTAGRLDEGAHARIFSLDTRALVQSIDVFPDGEWVAYTPDGMVKGPETALSKYVAWRAKGQMYEFSRFAR